MHAMVGFLRSRLGEFMRLAMCLGAVIALTGAATAQGGEQAPAACRADAQGRVNYLACVEAAPVGSAARALALINLGTAAYLENNFAEAVRRYDEALPPGKAVMSDIYFHAFRAGAYAHVGRDTEAYKDARFAMDILNGKPGLPPEVAQVGGDREPVYISILPILKAHDDPDFPGALAGYLALPARTWADWSNRAAVLLDLKEYDAAMQASLEALKLNAVHPGVLNNHCYVLTEAGRPAEAIPFCEKAVKAAPRMAAVHHSLATALAKSGRCSEADAALADARKLDPSSSTYKRALVCTAQ